MRTAKVTIVMEVDIPDTNFLGGVEANRFISNFVKDAIETSDNSHMKNKMGHFVIMTEVSK